MGSYTTAKRLLIADYKHPDGRDMNQVLTVWPHRGTPDKSLVKSVWGELAHGGCKLTSLVEMLAGGRTKALYLAPGCIEEVLHEMGVTIPADMPAAMQAVGVCPVNWEELAGRGRAYPE